MLSEVNTLKETVEREYCLIYREIVWHGKKQDFGIYPLDSDTRSSNVRKLFAHDLKLHALVEKIVSRDVAHVSTTQSSPKMSV